MKNSISINQKFLKIHEVILEDTFVKKNLKIKSKTYLKSFSRVIDSRTCESIIIPPNCANAILTLSHNTVLHYYMGDYFESKKYTGIRFDDPFFKIKWPFKPNIINDRDKNYPDFVVNK